MLLKHVIQPSQGLNEHISSLIGKLVASGREQVQGLVQVEVIVAVEVTAHKVVDLLLGEGVQVLELVKGTKLLDTQAIGRDYVRLSFQEMFSLVASDLTDCCEDMSTMGRGSFHTVAVVDTSITGFFVQIELYTKKTIKQEKLMILGKIFGIVTWAKLL